MTILGLCITFATVVLLIIEFLRHRNQPLTTYGWIGVVILLVAEWFMFRGFLPVAIYFTPIAWTAYILIADAAVLAITGHSRLQDNPRHFAHTALLSIPLWLIFEAYNLQLANWTYVGVPTPWALEWLGYGWSF